METVRDIPWRPGPLHARSARVAFAVSLLVHAVLIARIPDFSDIKRLVEPKTEPPLEVRLVPRLVVPPPPPPAAPVPRARPRIVPPPAAPAPKPAPPRASSPLTLPKAPAGDFSSYVAARQRERAAAEQRLAQPAPRVEDEDARAKRIAAANLASTRNLTFGFDPSKSGGIFQVTRLSVDYGEFLFHGWNIDAGRNTQQLIEVRRGDAGDIRLAIVRKMIEIIRRHEPVEFVWESDRLGRAVTLSSRQRDNAGLEDFMLQEFFSLKR